MGRNKEDRAKGTPAKGPPGSSLADLDAVRAEYAAIWGDEDAAHYLNEGHYAWMASFLDGCARILEIGTGEGTATIELLKRGHAVVGVDENPACLKRAKQKIAQAGFGAAYRAREMRKRIDDGYAIHYSALRADFPESGALLVDGDVLNDPELWRWLGSGPRFDAVICWMIGSHRARRFNAKIRELRPKTMREYQLLVENTVYELADKILRPGGVLHIVDRDWELTEETRRTLLASHRDQASVTALKVDDKIEQRPYVPPTRPRPIEGEDTNEPWKGVLVSITSRR